MMSCLITKKTPAGSNRPPGNGALFAGWPLGMRSQNQEESPKPKPKPKRVITTRVTNAGNIPPGEMRLAVMSAAFFYLQCDGSCSFLAFLGRLPCLRASVLTGHGACGWPHRPPGGAPTAFTRMRRPWHRRASWMALHFDASRAPTAASVIVVVHTGWFWCGSRGSGNTGCRFSILTAYFSINDGYLYEQKSA